MHSAKGVYNGSACRADLLSRRGGKEKHAVYELIEITNNNYYVNSPTKVGIYVSAPGEVWLIDSGSDKDAGKKVLRHAEAMGWKIQGILATHSHADHIGGAALIAQRTGCKVYASHAELAFVEHTVYEPALLWGGCPPQALRGKAMCAQSVECADVRSAPLPAGLEIIPLAGHSPAMFGLRTPEGVFYCADAVFSAEVVEKYPLNYLFDLRGTLETLERLTAVEAKWVLPAHADLTEDIGPLRDVNKAKMLEILALIESLCAEPTGFEALLGAIFAHYGLALNLAQYALGGSTLKAYLSYLLDEKRIEPVFEDNRLLWKAV